jgi:integrase
LKHEDIDDNGEVECYTAKELQSMLDRATMLPRDEERDYRELLPVIALGGLAGMRLKEILRLTWEDVFRVQDHIEVKAHKSKTRSRRLIQTCPALAQWLESYRERTGPVWAKGYDMLGEDFADLCAELKITKRRNALRHSFVSAHFAVHADEGLTSMQAGNSPAVVHKNYKGLMTKKEGEAWFNVRPENPSNVLHLATA